MSAPATNEAEVLDRIAEKVALDEDGGWSDMAGLLEDIAYLVMSTGRTVEGLS